MINWILIIGGIVLFAVVFLTISDHFINKHLEGLRAFALKHGYRFINVYAWQWTEGEGRSDELPGLDDAESHLQQKALVLEFRADMGLRRTTLPVFGRGRSFGPTPVLYRKNGTIGTAVLEYDYDMGSGKGGGAPSQTICMFHETGMDFPAFELNPQRVFQFPRRYEVVMSEDRAFSKQYLLIGKEGDRLLAMFNDRLRSALLDAGKLCVQAEEGNLIIFRHGKTVKPEKLSEFASEASTLYALFRERLPERV